MCRYNALMISPLLTYVYVFCALLLALYTGGQALLLLSYWRSRRQTRPTPAVDEWPTVAVQLPIYNERYVVHRLLKAVAQLDYPGERLIIQLLDDSTDSTSTIAAHLIAELQATGLRIQHVRRADRSGYKAGALAYALGQTDAEFTAIFDADFLPAPDFLRQTVPHLVHDPGLGVVQTRWGHLNADDNWLTQAQALSVDAHFVVEQQARSHAGWMLPFNGTGGVWRSACIADAGGWSADTLTEDLDLSYRAQLRGWRSLFLSDVMVPGELPPQMAAYKRQQGRWATGSTQGLLRFIGRVWQQPTSLVHHLMATHHLAQYIPHPLMLALVLLTPPLLALDSLEKLSLAPLGLVGLAPPLMIVMGQVALYRDWRRRLLAFPVLLLIGTGMTGSNTLAVMRGFSRRQHIFQRTPKFGQRWNQSGYALGIDPSTLIELMLALYALGGAWLALQTQPAVTPYLLVYALSYATVAGWELRDRWQIMRAGTERPAVST